jgi:hypothetical protein
MVVELKSIYQKGWGGGVNREYLGFEGTDEPVVVWGRKPESVILTRRRGDAEIDAEKQRERKNERGDSGGMSPSVRRGGIAGENAS